MNRLRMKAYAAVLLSTLLIPGPAGAASSWFAFLGFNSCKRLVVKPIVADPTQAHMKDALKALKKLELTETSKAVRSDNGQVVWRLSEKQLDGLPPGTMVVDYKTGDHLVIGVDYFRIDRADADGFTRYGITQHLAENQPLLVNPMIMNRKSYSVWPFPSADYHSLGYQTDGSFFSRYRLTPKTDEYLSYFGGHDWWSTGNYIKMGPNNRSEPGMTIYFSWETEPRPIEGIEIVFRSGSASYYQKIIDEVNTGLDVKIGGFNPNDSYPRFTLKTPAQMDGFFSKLMVQKQGGVDAGYQSAANWQRYRMTSSYYSPAVTEADIEFLKTVDGIKKTARGAASGG